MIFPIIFLKYLQLRILMVAQNQNLKGPPRSTLENMSSIHCKGKGIISALYNLQPESVRKCNSLKENIQEDILMDEWSSICTCTQAQTQTVNTQLKLLKYNWLIPAKFSMFLIVQIQIHDTSVITLKGLYFIVYGTVKKVKIFGRRYCI